ncbi:hypothetical protein F0919_04500 [Taibaiella lutea]|uniref:Uncharacterized protein n=1 Tax=Taibaiella lutea TaxID=2608001 RepID=A0A5M6CUS4_9BACT|nr:hypothetical protein [Taibaiella lutea]KAA5536939.1 hypothetical protein F0919_04500 [Taibaiella lutea]
MKQLKLMLLMAFFSLGFASVSFGQVGVVQNTITRNVCAPGYSGCYNGQVTLKLSTTGPFIISTTNIFPANQTISKDYPSSYKGITVTVAGLTSTGSYVLPAAIGDQVIITSGLDDGVHHAYTVGITKTGTYQYILAIGDYAY